MSKPKIAHVDLKIKSPEYMFTFDKLHQSMYKAITSENIEQQHLAIAELRDYQGEIFRHLSFLNLLNLKLELHKDDIEIDREQVPALIWTLTGLGESCAAMIDAAVESDRHYEA